MRIMINISAVVACGVLASLSGFVQSQPSKAASMTETSIATDAASNLASNPDFIQVRKSGSVEAHFAAANTTHDGHLTRDQALQADWSRVLRHFDEIDTGHHGWVTVADIHEFNQSHHKHR